MSGAAVAAALDRAITRHGKPKTITVDHGTELTSRALDDWAYRRGVALDFIRPGKPSSAASTVAFVSETWAGAGEEDCGAPQAASIKAKECRREHRTSHLSAP